MNLSGFDPFLSLNIVELIAYAIVYWTMAARLQACCLSFCLYRFDRESVRGDRLAGRKVQRCIKVVN